MYILWYQLYQVWCYVVVLKTIYRDSIDMSKMILSIVNLFDILYCHCEISYVLQGGKNDNT